MRNKVVNTLTLDGYKVTINCGNNGFYIVINDGLVMPLKYNRGELYPQIKAALATLPANFDDKVEGCPTQLD